MGNLADFPPVVLEAENRNLNSGEFKPCPPGLRRAPARDPLRMPPPIVLTASEQPAPAGSREKRERKMETKFEHTDLRQVAVRPTAKHHGGCVTDLSGRWLCATKTAHQAIVAARFGPFSEPMRAAWVRCGRGWRRIA